MFIVKYQTSAYLFVIGGIVLTTCLMAIAAFSWRFYKQCKDGSYRTL